MGILSQANNERRQLFSFRNGACLSSASPVVYNIESTNACPMTCIMCPRAKMTRPVRHMDIHLFRRIVDQAWRTTAFLWLDHFGDPLLHPNLPELIRYAHSRGIITALSTNATSLTPERSEQIIDARLDLLHVSLDGTDAETYRYYRGKAAVYSQAVENVSAHAEVKVKRQAKTPWTVAAMIVMDKTKCQMDEFRRVWTRPGIDEILFKQFTVFSGSVDAKSCNPDYQAPRIPQTMSPCYFPWSSLSVMSDGRVVPCCYDYDGLVELGNLNDQTLDEIWNGGAMQALRSQHLAGDYRGNPLCAVCKDRRRAPAMHEVMSFALRRLLFKVFKKNSFLHRLYQ